MKTFIVFRNSTSGRVDAVKRGYSGPALTLNLFQLGWLWAFAKRTPDFAWRLLAVTVITVILCNILPSLIIALICLLWIVFSINVGRIANKQIEKALIRRGFTQIGEFTSAVADQAIARAVAS